MLTQAWHAGNSFRFHLLYDEKFPVVAILACCWAARLQTQGRVQERESPSILAFE